MSKCEFEAKGQHCRKPKDIREVYEWEGSKLVLLNVLHKYCEDHRCYYDDQCGEVAVGSYRCAQHAGQCGYFSIQCCSWDPEKSIDHCKFHPKGRLIELPTLF